MIISVDFDNTLIGQDASGKAYPIKGAVEAMKTLKAAGCHIMIYTCRIGIAMDNGRLKEEIKLIAALLKEFDILYDEISMFPKPVADFYVDDRAIHFDGDWISPVQKIIASID